MIKDISDKLTKFRIMLEHIKEKDNGNILSINHFPE